MARSSPEKLAAALRANLRRRKQAPLAAPTAQAPERPGGTPPDQAAAPSGQDPTRPVENLPSNED